MIMTMKKVYVLLLIVLVCSVSNNVDAQLLQWNTFGNAGTETTEPSIFNDPNLSGVTNLTQGAGITPAANTNRFGGNNWWNTGNSVNSTLSEAVAGNDYLQFIVTPNVGFSFTPTSFVFSWDHSASGPNSVTLRSSVDGFTADLGSVTAMPASISTGNTIAISGLTTLTTATTFRLYGYGGTATGGTGGFDVASSVVNVQLNGTTAVVGGTPLITATPATLTGFQALSGVGSTEQTYSITGSDLTNDIIVTPPVGFEIATVTGGPYTVNPAFITLPQTGGVVGPLTIFVRMNSATLGPNAGVVSNTSTGATTKNVALSGNVLAPEPTVQSSITIGAVTNSSIVVNFSGGDGARRILLAKQTTAVDSDPVDGTTYTASANFGNGSLLGAGNYVVYDGIGNTQLVTGLTAGATYHFAVYEYNDGGVAGAENYLVPGGVGNATVASYSLPYVWIGPNNGLWTNPLNWAPDRLFPATNDSLLFTGGVLDTILNVPTQTVGYVGVSLNTFINLQAGAANNILTIGNLTGTDLFVETGSQLNIGSANALTLNLVTGATAAIDGYMRFTAGAHKLTAVDASAVTFTNGSTFRAGMGFSSNPFGTTNLNSIIFNSGSVMEYYTGSNPFGAAQPNSVVVFQTGSLYKVVGPGFSPSFSGRTYANVEFAGTGTSSMTGGSAVSIDNLTVTSGIVNIGMTGIPGHAIKGNISVAAGAELNFAPAAAGTMNLNGIVLQTISNLGIISSGVNQTLNVDNAAGVTLNAPVSISGTLNFTTGIVKTTQTNLLTMAAGSSVTGASNGSYVDGPVKKIGASTFTFPVGKTGFGYVPIGISNFVGGFATDEFIAEYRRGSARVLGPVNAGPGLDHVSGCDYWTLDRNVGAAVVDITCFWSANNTCFGTYIDNLGSLTIAHFNTTTTEWDTYAISPAITGGSTTAAGSITWTSVAAFSPFSLASTTFGQNPLPITINYFNGIKQNGNHLLNWKVTCTSTPFATIEMERSIDGRNYSSIYSIYATALRCQQPFDYTDASPAAGVNYYRLKMTDANGKITYSSTVSLLNASKGIDILSIAPNPIVGGKFDLRVSAAQKTQMDIIITDMQGRVMQKRTVSMIAGFNAIPVNVRQFATGTYQVYGTTADGRSKVLRFVVQ
jgi:hypothetical protein